MLLKYKDSRQPDIKVLTRLLSLELTREQRHLIQQELDGVVDLEKRELEIASFLDFHYRESRNWALIHDLRLERNGEVALVDHLLINRFLDVYVIDSRYYYHGMKISEDGGFLLWGGTDYRPVASPLEANRVRIELLRLSVGERDLGPRRLGYPVPIKYRNIILFSPAANLVKPQGPAPGPSAINADEFVSWAETTMSSRAVLDSSKMVGYDILREFGEKVVRLHRRRPELDPVEKFGFVPEIPDEEGETR